ncbi:MAG: PAS domain S-box protein, partial [Aggregatilineales bacterium]
MTEIKPHLKIEKLEKTIQDLREREIRLRASVNAHTDLCLIIDKDGHISDIVSNQGQLLPEENRSLIGQSLQNILPNVGGTDFLHELSLVVEGRKSHQFVYEHDNQQFIARLTPLEESHDSTKLVIMSIVLSSDQRRNMHQGVSEVLSEKLLVSQQLAFELLESIGEAFYGLDRDWCFIYLNRKAEQLWGRNRDELIGKNIWEEFPQGVDTQAYREMHRAIEEQCAVSFETYSSFLDAWVEVEVYPTMSGLSVYFHDRTRRKTAEVALQASEEKYRQIVETAQEGIWIIDAENRTSFVNPKMAEMLGYSIEEMLGTSIFDYMDEEGQAITARSIETGGLKTKGLHEFSFTKKDGSRLYGLLSKTPLFDDVGTYVGALAMLVDIGDRKQTSDAQAQLAAIVNSSGDAIISMTLGGIVTSWNSSAEEIYGYSTEEMIGKSINILIPPEGWEGEAALLIRAASGEIVQNLEASRLRKNGTEIFISITVSPMRDSYNNIIGVSKIARDITEQKLKEVQLRESEAALKQAQRVARIGSWTWHVQTDRLEWSDEMYHIFGIDKETFSGELSEVISHAIHPNDRAAVERANASVIKTGASAPLEYRVIWEDGTIRDVWAEAGNMILDSAGKPTILTGIVQDITERKRAEKSLRESEERYRTLFETMKQGIVYQDETGAITAANLA